jgi:hypothetical protein
MKALTKVVVCLDHARFGAGPATVIEVSQDSVRDILSRYQDRDGARSDRLRIWLMLGAKVGDRVSLEERYDS